jgi:hypothetical protein
MGFLLPALAIGGALLGGLGGKSRADASGKPTVTKTTIGPPPAELGGYGRINDALNMIRDRQPYQSGMNNPYMAGVFGHVLGRAGIQAPEGGYGNPYMQRMMQQQGQPQGPQQNSLGLSPEQIARLRELIGGGVPQINAPGSGGGM